MIVCYRKTWLAPSSFQQGKDTLDGWARRNRGKTAMDLPSLKFSRVPTVSGCEVTCSCPRRSSFLGGNPGVWCLVPGAWLENSY